MVTASDLMVPESVIREAFDLLSIQDSPQGATEFFAALSWSVICEPGDGFAGKLIDTFGAAQALSFELQRLSPQKYVSRFAEAGSDWVEMQEFGKFEQVLSDARERWGSRFSLANVAEAVKKATVAGAWFITADNRAWPYGLLDLGKHTPRGLWGRGDASLLTKAAIAIVGSRMASAYGEYATGELVGTLVNAGYCIVSGGAYGIDAMAHRASLAMGGDTVSVMAGGIDKLYPSGNAALLNEIGSSGCLITEMPPGSEPTKWRFLQRNRIIAALGQATVVVEANPKSGAVSTANRAQELGRALGAVPGHINSPGADGCHRLIREADARLITSGHDVLEMLGRAVEADRDQLPGLGALETRVNDVIGHGGANLEMICHEAGLTRSEAQIGISGLLLAGLIEQDSEGWRRKH